MRRAVALISTLCLLTLAACNTAEGLGQDVENAGEAIEQEAEE